MLSVSTHTAMSEKIIRYYTKTELCSKISSGPNKKNFISRPTLKREAILALSSVVKTVSASDKQTIQHYIDNWDSIILLPPIICNHILNHLGITEA